MQIKSSRISRAPLHLNEKLETISKWCSLCFKWLNVEDNTLHQACQTGGPIACLCKPAEMFLAFTPPPLEKVIVFCTAETNFVLHSKQNKNKYSRLKMSKVVKKGGKKSTQNLKKAGKSCLAFAAFHRLPQASAGFRGLLRANTF